MSAQPTVREIKVENDTTDRQQGLAYWMSQLLDSILAVEDDPLWQTAFSCPHCSRTVHISLAAIRVMGGQPAKCPECGLPIPAGCFNEAISAAIAQQERC